MGDWHLDPKKLKSYPHFDAAISIASAQALATDPDRVARHKFFPFLNYSISWTKFAEKGNRGERKNRPIRYAARTDSYIFSYYRHVLLQRYEAELKRIGLSDCVIAYRHIPTDDETGGKCNIHHARDAFRLIEDSGDCFVLALDISKF